MSSRRNYGRFSSSTANEAYQRQLTAPVHKWKKQWVSPSGLAPESSYKICKWVRIKEKANFTGGTTENDDLTPAPEGEDEEGADEGEGEGEGEGEEGEGEVEGGEDMDEDDNEADEEGVADDAAEENKEIAIEAPTTDPTASTADPAVTASTATQETVEAPPAADTVLADTAATTVTVTEVPPTETPAEVPETSETTTPAPVVADESTHEAPLPPTTEIPSNAMEVTNTTTFSAESGLADVGASGVEVTVGSTTAPHQDAEEVKEPSAAHDEAMDIEEPTLQPSTDTEAGAAAAAPEEAPVENDEGLVMGEVEPPVPELKVDNGDQPPAETEQ